MKYFNEDQLLPASDELYLLSAPAMTDEEFKQLQQEIRDRAEQQRLQRIADEEEARLAREEDIRRRTEEQKKMDSGGTKL